MRALTDEQREELKAENKRKKDELQAHLQRCMDEGQRIAIDMSFADDSSALNTEQEARSLVKQLSYVYSVIKKEGCISLHLASYQGELATLLDQSGCQSWKVHRHNPPVEKVFDVSELVYLTPDSPNDLTELDKSSVYVIGGIIDRTRTKRISFDKAEACGIRTARLPLGLAKIKTAGLVLNIDTVIKIIAEFQSSGDWEEAIRQHVPKRLLPSTPSVPSSAAEEDEPQDPPSTEAET